MGGEGEKSGESLGRMLNITSTHLEIFNFTNILNLIVLLLLY